MCHSVPRESVADHSSVHGDQRVECRGAALKSAGPSCARNRQRHLLQCLRSAECQLRRAEFRPLLNAGGGGLRNWVSTPAVFGGLYWDATGRLKMSAEARYQWNGIAQQQLFPAATAKLSGRFTSFSPRVTVDFHLANESLLYASASRGYRPGGFNAVLLVLTPFVVTQLSNLGTNITYNQEELDSYEIGHKATWLGNRLRTTLACTR